VATAKEEPRRKRKGAVWEGLKFVHHNSLQLEQSALVIVDMQEAFREKISDFTQTARRISVMTQAAKLLRLPILVTEQYPKGLGHTAQEIKEVLPAGIAVVEKTSFSSCGAQPFKQQLKEIEARQLLVCGIEAHICVNQTVHDLLADGYQVHLLIDCITSRSPTNREIGLAKMQASGAISSSVELALFEMMRDASHEQFRAVQSLIK
jgi:nicotinamidase-related amidase